MAIENLQLFNAMNEEEVKRPPLPPMGKPFTPMESHLEIMNRVNACIASVNAFEERMKFEIDSFMNKANTTNTGFKEAIQESFNNFLVTVQNEVNNFESLMKNDNTVFKNELSGQVAIFEASIERIVNEYRLQLTEIVNNYKTQTSNHMTEQDEKIEAYKKYMVDNLVSSLSNVFDNKVANGEISDLLTQLYGNTQTFKGSKTYAEITAISNANNGDYYYCTTDEHYYMWSSSWIDIGTRDKIANDYEAYKLNNDSLVDFIINDSDGLPFETFTNCVMFKGSSSGKGYTWEKATTEFFPRNYYFNTLEDANKNSIYAFLSKLTNPIKIDERNDGYYLYINSDITTRVYVLLSSAMHWGLETTTAGNYFAVKKGINLIKLENLKISSNNDHSEFLYIGLDASYEKLLAFKEIKVLKNSSFINGVYSYMEYIDKKHLFRDLTGACSMYANNVTANFTYENSKITVNVDAKTTENAEWRYFIFSIELGTDLTNKFLVVKDTSPSGMYFGLGSHSAQWSRIQFTTEKNKMKIINLDELRKQNNALMEHTGIFYLIFGYQLGNPIAMNEAMTFETYVIEMNVKDNPMNPLINLADLDPSEFVKNKDLPVEDPIKIICWGDSLTAQGGWTNTLQELTKLTVVNCGTGGENSNTILARQGADCIVVNNITIPSTETPILLTDYATKFKTLLGKTVSPLLQGGYSHVNPCKIGDIEGTLTFTGSAYNDTTGTWTFTRKGTGESVIIKRPTELTTFADNNYNTTDRNIHIFFIGTNDGSFDVEEMANKLKLAIAHCKSKNYLVIGLSRAISEEHINTYKSKMKEVFGRRFLDLHGYLFEYGLDDAGLTATDEDVLEMASGRIPKSLTSDGVHYTDSTRTIIGKLIYNRLRDLHMI